MATRRNVTTNLESSTKEFPKPSLNERSNITPAVPAHVIYKLLGFTFAMIVGPIGTYFIMNSLTGNSTWSGATAAIVANIVVIGYVIVAFNEDDGGETTGADGLAKKSTTTAGGKKDL